MGKSIAPGERFGRLTASELSGRQGYWLCVCECGNRKEVRSDHLRSGGTSSCGCLHSETTAARAHVLSASRVKHGMSKTTVYSVWNGMKFRCLNEKSTVFPYYGGRGIKVCERWLTFENFLADMGEPPAGGTLDRLDNDGNYCPENCAWRTRRAQQNNRRVNVRVTYQGEEMTLTELSRLSGVHFNTLRERLGQGVPVEAAIDPGRRPSPGLALGASVSASARRARTHCKNGHEWTPQNTAKQKTGRACRRCHANRMAGRPVES